MWIHITAARDKTSRNSRKLTKWTVNQLTPLWLCDNNCTSWLSHLNSSLYFQAEHKTQAPRTIRGMSKHIIQQNSKGWEGGYVMRTAQCFVIESVPLAESTLRIHAHIWSGGTGVPLGVWLWVHMFGGWIGIALRWRVSNLSPKFQDISPERKSKNRFHMLCVTLWQDGKIVVPVRGLLLKLAIVCIQG